MRIADKIRGLNTLQKLSVPLMVVFFVCMNMGFVKYNDAITIVSIIILTALSIYGIKRYAVTLKSPISGRAYRLSLLSIFVVFFIIQTLVCLYVPLGYYSDFIIVRDQAIHMASENSVIRSEYFQSYPYQLNIVFIINALYNIFGSYKGVEIFTTALVNLSAILTAMTVCNVCHNRKIALITAAMLNVFSTLCLKTYLPYSSNIGFVFPILMVYVYTSSMPRTKKAILMALVVVLGSRVKITTIIPFIAMLIFGGYKLIKERDFRSIAIGIASVAVFYLPVIYVHNSLIEKVGYVYDRARDHGFIYYVAMGQNNPTGGQYNYDIGSIGDKEFPSKESRDKFFLDMAIQSVKERSAIGQVKFFASKIAYCWGETKLDHLTFSRYDDILLIIKHYTWYLALTLMTLGIFLIRDSRYYMLLLGIWGVIAYIYLSEAGARYVLMYMPIVYMMAGWTVVSYINKTITCNTHR